MRYLRAVSMAFSMYSRLPMPWVRWSDDCRAWVLCAFPLVGAVLGLLLLAWSALADLLTLTPMGCALLPEPAAVTAGILLLPGDCPRSDLRAGTVVTYGLSPRDSITLSSLREPVLCVQRTLPLLCGGVLEPQEFPLPGVEGAERLLPGVGTRLLWTGSPYPL